MLEGLPLVKLQVSYDGQRNKWIGATECALWNLCLDVPNDFFS